MQQYVNILRRMALLPVYFYQFCISPWLPARCRFLPSCSSYTIEAVMQYGVFRGGFLAIKRVSRCHPWGGAGYDPVTDEKKPHEKQ